ncbi:MAG: peptidoglycan endopeptidase, partial [Solirubrobacteraceae bacterium]
APETSGQLESWGAPGPGRWITVYANAGHTYMYVNIGGAWMLYDTAGRSGVLTSRWQPSAVDNEGYVVRHWPGL